MRWCGLSFLCVVAFAPLGALPAGPADSGLPAYTLQPRPQTVWARQTATFRVAATGGDALSLQWQVSTDVGTTYADVTDAGPYAGAATSTLIVASASTRLNGNLYRCVARSSEGATTSVAARLLVRAPTEADFNGDGQPDLLWNDGRTGQVAAWLMDGARVGSYAAIDSLTDANWRIAGAADLDGDFNSDIVWRNRATGEVGAWLMHRAAYASFVSIGRVTDPGWHLDGLADLNQDGSVDLLWRHLTTGRNIVWFMNGVRYGGYGDLGEVPDTDWRIVGSGDFDRDGQADLLWRHTGTGQAIVWFMDGIATRSYASLEPAADPAWSIATVADVDADGRIDIVWRNYTTGENAIWLLDGTTYLRYEPLAAAGTTWRMLSGANRVVRMPVPSDFNQDGKPDILWRNGVTGENIVWFMDGAAYAGYSRLGAIAGFTAQHYWKGLGTGDFNGDGKSDILWRNNSHPTSLSFPYTGVNLAWFMNGTAVRGSANVGDPSGNPKWWIAAAADFNDDDNLDVLWRNADTGDTILWYLRGTTYVSSERLATAPGVQWQIAAAADFNGDARPDILWRNYATGENIVWLMNGSSYVSYVRVDTVADTNWKLVMAADFNSDGKPDILWRHATTGENIVWILNGAAYVRYERVLTVADTNWKIGPQQY